MRTSGKRFEWLDFGKAMGILVVLLVHAGCSLGYVTFYGGMFYMPVFFVAAGYTYRYKEGESFMDFAKKKALRLLAPYAGASVFLWLFFWVKDSLLGGMPPGLRLSSAFGILYSRNQMYTASRAGENPVLMDVLNAPLWFLTAMFLVYVYYRLAGQRRGKYRLLACGLAVSLAWHYNTRLLLPWSLDAVPYFACFFAVGEGLRERKVIEYLCRKRYWNAVLVVLFAVCARINGSVNLSCGVYGRSMLLYLVVGSLGSVLVFMAGAALESLCRPLVRVAGWVGQETLLILCFHMFTYMFIGAAAGLLGLQEGLSQAAEVTGSLALLTGAGKLFHHLGKQESI